MTTICSTLLSCAKTLRTRFRLSSFKVERMKVGLVRFAPCKVRCGRTVHCDRDTGLSGFRPVCLTRWLNSDRRQVERVIQIVGRWPLTDVVPTVQLES